MIGPGHVGDNWYFCAFYLLLLLLPLSFVLPALWRASRTRSPEAVGPSRRWLAVLAAAVALLVLRTVALAPQGRPAWLLALGAAVPLLFAVAGVGGAVLLGRRSWAAAGLALAGGCGLAAWMSWLHDHLRFGPADTGSGSPSVVLLAVAVLGAAVAAVLVLRSGGSPFGLLLAAAFGYLALSAMYNWSRLGLVAAVVICGNLGPWVAGLRPAPPGGIRPGWGGRLAVGLVLLAWVCAILGGVYPKWVGGDFGLGEQPLLFAHAAARFAGQPAMPARNVVFPLETAALAVYHQAPGHRTFMDSRMELPSRETFQTYLTVQKMLGEGNLSGLVDLRAPVVLTAHTDHARAEAALLRDPNWRLVYFDALAAVFLARGDAELEERFPTLDLGQRHFADPATHSVPDAPGAAAKEARALLDLGAMLQRAPSARWRLRVPILLAALDRAEAALREEPVRAANWLLLANGHWGLLPDLQGPPRSPLEGWHAETGLAWAQTTYCLRRGLECDPDDTAVLRALQRCYAAREMADAQEELSERSRAPTRPGPGVERGPASSRQLPAELQRLLENRQLAAAGRLAEQALADGAADWDWPLADQLAGACLHLGRPALARQLWQRAQAPPSEAVRQSRLADACWVERDFYEAIRHYEEARRLDPRLAEPRWALAWLYAELGQAGPALAACRQGLSLPLPPELRDELSALEKLLQGSAP
jgi:tetratricopeptide (TPR) repeat protein